MNDFMNENYTTTYL